MSSTILDLLEHQANCQPNAFVLLSVDHPPCTYQQLWDQITYSIEAFNEFGIGRNDPVAIVLPNGPLMASAFLAIASGMASAPLNPTYQAAEYEFFLDDLQAKAIVVEEGSENPVIEVAKKLNKPLIYLKTNKNQTAGQFELFSDRNLTPIRNSGKARPSDIALILHTSGTTSKPKMVPLTQKNLCISANNIAETLKLSADDRCLNIMPLFHIHGLMAAVMASITAGSSIVCTPGFFAPRFYDWLDKFHPSWYTAVPTMHQSILNRSKDNPEIIKRSTLRFIRSSSASLPPNIMADIETTFDVPVIEAYGMTEASHQMASNALPPGIRKPGSVGLPAGPEVAIMDEVEANILPKGNTGEIVIRGENVTLGYLNNQQANQDSFTNGWFHTGDQGFFDEDGYLFITGRLKEIINRGGEKISPREVDEVLIKHPAVSQVVTFSIPDEVLGEDVAAAIVLKDLSITEIEIKQFTAAFLAQHKVPGQIIFLDEIPKGPTGKLQRIGLAEKLGFSHQNEGTQKEKPTYQPPQTEIEQVICDIWQKIIDHKKIGIHDRFRDAGGDSMLATLIHTEIQTYFGIRIDLVDLYAASTIIEQGRLIEEKLSQKRK